MVTIGDVRWESGSRVREVGLESKSRIGMSDFKLNYTLSVGVCQDGYARCQDNGQTDECKKWFHDGVIIGPNRRIVNKHVLKRRSGGGIL